MLVFAVAAAAFYLIETKPEPKAQLIESKPVIVAVATVQRRDIRPTRVVSGRLQAATKLELRFEVNGRVKSRLVEPGQQVEAGALLLALEDGDYHDMVVEAQAQLDQEQGAIARDRRLLAIAERSAQLQAEEVKRLERLSRSSLAAQSLLDNAHRQFLQLSAEQESLSFSVNSAASRLALRQSALRRAKRNLERTRLVAPFDCIVNSVEADVGDFVGSAQVVMEVLAQGRLDLAIEVDGDTARVLALEQTVPVTINNQTKEGRIVALQSDPDSETFTHAVRIRLTDAHMLPGTLASTELALAAEEDVLVVPVTAILHEAGAAYIFRLVGDRLQRVPVVTGTRHGDVQVISGEIDHGDVIVSRDVAALSDGQRISRLH